MMKDRKGTIGLTIYLRRRSGRQNTLDGRVLFLRKKGREDNQHMSHVGQSLGEAQATKRFRNCSSASTAI